ncbi:hypothetical protein BKA64DRAFT_667101 [Cadophora sp. MPI-SDFR-AT-0126]|nr:hypothetical protein BKA64DRAFT_667101 [Leotiomycetes sp. MPI-SDFR-AT-0126]
MKICGFSHCVFFMIVRYGSLITLIADSPDMKDGIPELLISLLSLTTSIILLALEIHVQ